MKGLSKYFALVAAVFLLFFSAGNSYGQVIGHTILGDPNPDLSYENTVAVTATDVKGPDESARAWGVYVEPSTTPLDLFHNTDTGSISATAEIGNVTIGSIRHFAEAFGVFFEGRNVTEFTNSGTISATATAGDATGNN